ncbi:MAG: DsbA family oxidoreductase [Nitrospirales bacterium]|nr:DsbA family oxidoreductase [Nitrospirales bacterium]
MNDHGVAHGLAIDIYSDVVCPWCYIGKRRLEGALYQSSVGQEHRVTWRPFELNPTMPRPGMDRRVYLEGKFGGPEALRSMQDRVAAVGEKEGIPFAFDLILMTPNTFDAHRLIWHAEQQKKQDDVVEALFHGYFIEGLDIGELEVLASIAQRSGLDGADACGFLKSHKGEAEVREAQGQGQRLGLRAVPHFVLNERLAISGAQPVETFRSAIEQVTNGSGITQG